jgi:hypothetical protein
MSLENLFWDSCLFIRYVSGDTTQPFYEDISRFVDEAKSKRRRIHFSTLTFAEMRQEHFKGSSYGGIRDFFHDLGANFYPIAPDPNIMIMASEIRSARSTNPGDPGADSRVVATPDAIILATALFARDSMKVADLVLQSTDEGKGKSWAGKCIPIVGFERWYPEATRTPRIQQVCELPKERPSHPEPMLGLVVHHDFGQSGGDDVRR